MRASSEERIPFARKVRLAAVSVDLDEIRLYREIHGVGLRGGGQTPSPVVYQRAVPRLCAWAATEGLPLTWFVVGKDLESSDTTIPFERVLARGDEIGNHSLDHRYDLSRLSRLEIERQVHGAQDMIESAIGVRPVGFRAPGYTQSEALMAALHAAGLVYDSSVFPCPAYYAAKAAALGVQRLVGRRSASILAAPQMLRAPRQPYRVGTPFWCRGAAGLIEIPIQVTPRWRLPFIGTSLTLAGLKGARYLARSIVGQPFVNLELHGIDALDCSDGLADLKHIQPDLQRSVPAKLQIFSAAVSVLRNAGYVFVTMRDIASRQ